jgi:hypothetical protein
MLMAAACATEKARPPAPSGGAAPYTPTALEWFVVTLNAAQRRVATDTQPGYWFQESPPETVLVLLTDCGGTMKLSDIRQTSEAADALVKSWGRNLPWLKTKVEVCGRPLEWLPPK